MERTLPEIDLEKCTGCGDCIDRCLTHAVSLLAGKATVTNPGDCNYCADCEGICPSGAIRCPFDIILTAAEGPKDREKPNRMVAGETIRAIILSDF